MTQSPQKQRIYIFGSSAAGARALEYFQGLSDEYEILGWLDNDARKHGSIILGYEVFPPEIIRTNSFDRIWIASSFDREIRQQLREEFQLQPHQYANIPMGVLKGNVRLDEGAKRALAVELLSRVSSILLEAGLPFYVDHGTLLGLVRDGHLLPWDNDVDLAIPAEHAAAIFEALQRRVPTLNFSSCEHNDWRVRAMEGIVEFDDGGRRLDRIFKVYNAVDDACSRHLTLDLILKYLDKGRRYWMVSSYTLSVDDALTTPLGWHLFNGVRLPIPGNVDGYLTALYNDWRTPVQTWEHTLYANLEKAS